MPTQERTTKEITTPSGHKIVIFDYMTGGELRKIQALYLEHISAGDFGSPDMMKKVPVVTMMKAQELALEMLIVSVNNETTDCLKKVLDFREEDLDVVIKEVDQYASGTTTIEKKS